MDVDTNVASTMPSTALVLPSEEFAAAFPDSGGVERHTELQQRLAALEYAAQEYMRRPDEMTLAYAADWRAWQRYCVELRISPTTTTTDDASSEPSRTRPAASSVTRAGPEVQLGPRFHARVQPSG